MKNVYLLFIKLKKYIFVFIFIKSIIFRYIASLVLQLGRNIVLANQNEIEEFTFRIKHLNAI